ncbi:MAG: hypothetical protein D4R73_02295 [Deltaproteobacteria bacterium]|nr:MAG: hypothetical protein D4R73_02295 [Deltaproteobacteria bacterium]
MAYPPPMVRAFMTKRFAANFSISTYRLRVRTRPRRPAARIIPMGLSLKRASAAKAPSEDFEMEDISPYALD